jgi:hypothetical protein
MAAEKQDQQSDQLGAALTDQERFRLLVNAVTDYAMAKAVSWPSWLWSPAGAPAVGGAREL